MSATKELRKMLDERGVNWGNVKDNGSESDYFTEWQLESDQGKAIATEWAVGSGLSVVIQRHNLTPEQAIEVALGRGKCHNAETREGYFACSGCGFTFSSWGGFGCDCGDDPDFRYCPECGREVES